jgi:hypothetical protein
MMNKIETERTYQRLIDLSLINPDQTDRQGNITAWQNALQELTYPQVMQAITHLHRNHDGPVTPADIRRTAHELTSQKWAPTTRPRCTACNRLDVHLNHHADNPKHHRFQD